MDDEQKITYFGETNFHNQRLRFGIKKIDRRKHMYVVGKTGMGKTTLLENMAMQDIQNGEGMAFIDPHGDTAYKLLDFVPANRINDVIYFDPADVNFPIALNVMESVDPDRRHFVASGLMAVFKKIFGPDVWSARMEYILGNTILALLEYPDSTLLSINPMLAVKEFRKRIVEQVSDPVVKAFWTQEFAKYTERFAAEATPAIQNKIGQFTSNALIRNIVGQPKSSFDFRKAMDEKKIIIINLAKGRVGEDTSRLLGAMIVTKMYLAAMSRVDVVDENQRPDFYLYVDEFQNFATESFANILSEARKYRLSLVLAHQYMAQLDEKVRDAVIGNMGTMLTFRVGAEDADFLEKEFSPEFMANDIVNLGFSQIYLKLMIDGVASHPFSASTLPPIANKQASFREDITRASQHNYGTERASVDELIRKWTDEISAEDAMTPSGKDGGEKGGFKATSGPMYDATCYVCGKKTQVPFQPDPRRPVFCKEHIGIAGKFPKVLPGVAALDPAPTPVREVVPPTPEIKQPEKVAASIPVATLEVERAPIVAVRPGAGSVVSKQDPRSAKQISLRDLTRHAAPMERTRHNPAERPQNQKQNHLAELREALKKSMEARKQTGGSQAPSVNTEKSIPSVVPPPSGARTPIRPGEKIEL